MRLLACAYTGWSMRGLTLSGLQEGNKEQGAGWAICTHLDSVHQHPQAGLHGSLHQRHVRTPCPRTRTP